MRTSGPVLRPGEQILAVALTVIGGIIVVAVPALGAPVDWAAYAPQAFMVLALTLVGLTYRLTGRDERIASATLSAGFLIAFTAALATYNYLLLPVSRPLIDPWLARTNTLFGYDWGAWVEWAAGWPTLSTGLRLVYGSSLAQISLLIVALAGARRFAALDRMAATLVFAAISTVVSWGVFPSISVSAFQSISDRAAAIVAPTVGLTEGAELLHLVRFGPERIAPDAMTGVIGFPSFHTILALLCIRFAWELPLLRLPLLAANLVMLPAILIHGSHHVLDLLGGGLFFLVSRAVADRVVARLDGRRRPATLAHSGVSILAA